MIPLLLQLGLPPQNCLKCKVHAMQVANTWRTTQDISLAIQATWGTVMDNLDGTTALARFAGPGAWNDADMLEVQTAIPSHPHCQTRRQLFAQVVVFGRQRLFCFCCCCQGDRA